MPVLLFLQPAARPLRSHAIHLLTPSMPPGVRSTGTPFARSLALSQKIARRLDYLTSKCPHSRTYVRMYRYLSIY